MATFTALTAPILSMNQSDSPFGTSDKVLESSINWLRNVDLETCWKLPSGLTRASDIAVNGYVKASSGVLI